MLLGFVVVFGFLIFSKVGISYHILLLPLIFLAEYLMALGFTLFFSAITVYLRDMEYIVSVLLMAWIWATPIMYAVDTLEPTIAKLLLINPLTSVIMSYHNILYYHTVPTPTTLIGILLVGVVLLIIGEVVFVRLEGNFAEEL